MEPTLTNNQAYEAMLCFLKKMHGEFGWKQLGPLLGSMALVDGIPMDAALTKDWSEAAKLFSRGNDQTLDAEKLTREKAYLAMSSFLEEMFDAGREDLAALICDMQMGGGQPHDRSLIEPWKNAIDFVQGGGKPEPYVLVKDGVIHRVHRDQSGLKKS